MQSLFRNLTLCVIVALASSCDQRGGNTLTSSGSFFGLVPSTTEPRVEALFTRIDILKAINPGLIGDNPDADPVTTVLGKFNESEFVLWEPKSATLLKADLTRDRPLTADVSDDPNNPNFGKPDRRTLAFSRGELIAEFRPAGNPSFQLGTILTIFDGVIFGYENSSRSLFVIQRTDEGYMDVQTIKRRTQIDEQIKEQQFNFNTAVLLPERTTAVPGGGRVAEILLISSVPTQDSQLFIVRQDANGNISGDFRVFDEFGTPIDPQDIFQFPEVSGFLRLLDIQIVVDVVDVDIVDFRPRGIPGLQSVMMFEKTTSSFLQLDMLRNAAGEIFAPFLDLFSLPGEVQATLLAGNPAFQEIPVDIQISFNLPDRPLMLAFEEETNTMLALDYSRPKGTPRVSILAESSNLLLRRDHQGGVDVEFGLQETELSFAKDTLRNSNLLAFDRGNDHLLSLNVDFGRYVVVLKQPDLAAETGLFGISDLTYIESQTDTRVLAMDTQGNSLVEIRLQYALFPINIR